MDKAEQVLNFLADAPNMDLIAFQFGQQADGSVTFNTVSSDTEIARYIDGSALKHFDFAISIYTPMTDDPYVTDNLTNWCGLQSFGGWLRQKNKNREFPDFGENCKIDSVSALTNMPSVSLSKNEKTAKYMYMCRVEYVEHEI